MSFKVIAYEAIYLAKRKNVIDESEHLPFNL